MTQTETNSADDRAPGSVGQGLSAAGKRVRTQRRPTPDEFLALFDKAIGPTPLVRELLECEAIKTIPAATAGLLALLEHPRMSRPEDAQHAPLEPGDVVAVLTSGVVTQ